jgi:hypothetical protein
MKKILGFIFLLASALLSAQAQDEKRVALVIGNSAYKTSPLKNPVSRSAQGNTFAQDNLKKMGY